MNSQPRRFERIAFVASQTPEAEAARATFVARHGDVAPNDADVIVALGGDGLMLQTLHKFMTSGKPIYGMHRGTVGFLMNDFHEDRFVDRLSAAQTTVIHPLRMTATDASGVRRKNFAPSTKSRCFRASYQAARLRILVDGRERLAELIADGLLVATPAGSTAYNLSVQGPIIPIGAPLLALTAISPFRPRRWLGALLPDKAQVTIDVLDPGKRPVAAVADHDEVRDVQRVEISMDQSIALNLLFDPDHSLDERILREQFRVLILAAPAGGDYLRRPAAEIVIEQDAGWLPA